MNKTALTEQQQEVLRLWNGNISVSAIAKVMNISTQRVYQHLQRLGEMGLIKR